MIRRLFLTLVVAFGLGSSVLLGRASARGGADPKGEAEVAVGERLFLDPRFSQVYFQAPASGPGELPRVASEAFFRQAIGSGRPSTSCASCHFIDQQDDVPGKGPRAYSDFEERSEIPARADGLTQTVRNSPTLIDVLAAESPTGESLTHFDGEFARIEDLVIGGLTGRNFGWLPAERDQAVAHIARVIREDAGDPEAGEEGPVLPYRALLRVPQLLESDEAVLREVARLIAVYLRSIQFIRDEEGELSGSPYDAFLKLNGLPRAPAAGESPLVYARRLRDAVAKLESPQFVSAGEMKRHSQSFEFGPQELEGFRVFFSEKPGIPRVASHVGVGQCIQCHAPPLFTDFGFRAVGIAQRDLDRREGLGSFEKLWRQAERIEWVPPTIGRDFGAWHVLSQPRATRAKELLSSQLCQTLLSEGGLADCSEASLKRAAFGSFKTPTLRNLGQNAPYFHDGSSSTLRAAITHYVGFSEMQRRGQASGTSSIVGQIQISGSDVRALEAFLKSLNEDYE